MTSFNKQAAYEEAIEELDAILADIDDRIAIMATVSCVLKMKMPAYFWVGFYIVKGNRLIVGPYQGTLGCLFIDFGRGVCGTAAAERRTVIVADVARFPGHIACDARSASEIVVPVFDADDALIAVLDVDSEQLAAFDETDRRCLETLARRFFATRPLT